jgi:hypothetical protein
VAEAVGAGNVADARLGQAVHLVVRASGEEIQMQCDDLPTQTPCSELPNFMQPQHIHWRAAMPLGPNGKIDRAGLQQELAA